MAGGSGTRFWPLSRQRRPKQMLALAGKAPLIVQTAQRIRPLAPSSRTFVVCGRAHAPAVRKLLRGLPAKNILVEPVARNTAPCIGLAAAVVAHRDPRGILVVLPSDQHVADGDRFRAAIASAARAAADGSLVTLGIKPTSPETGFGYLQRGDPIGADGVHAVERFVEKPDLEKARQYLASGDYFWNAGIFVFRADRILEEIGRHLPEAREPLEAIAKAVGTPRFPRVLARNFPLMPAISIDFGVMEKASGIAVVPVDPGWSDVGSFPALCGIRRLDAQGNVVEGEAILVDVSDSVVIADKRPLALVGLHGMIVVDAGDAMLVCPKDRAQDVRKVVSELTRRRLAHLL
jgi:mannose-1-phosphate guanylyltransferase